MVSAIDYFSVEESLYTIIVYEISWFSVNIKHIQRNSILAFKIPIGCE